MATSQRSVLVDAEDLGIRTCIVEALHNEGSTVAEAVDGTQAIHLLEQHRPPARHFCLVRLDMMLSRVDGCGVFHRLAQLDAYLPVIAMSASSQTLAAAASAGVQATLPKPLDLHRLLTAVARNRLRGSG